MLNKIFLMGRLTRDPELRRTQGGVSVVSFSLAVERDYKDQSGNRQTDFVEVQDWTDKDGNKRRSTVVVADSVYFGDSKKDTAPAEAPPQEFHEINDDDGELPF